MMWLAILACTNVPLLGTQIGVEDNLQCVDGTSSPLVDASLPPEGFSAGLDAGLDGPLGDFSGPSLLPDSGATVGFSVVREPGQVMLVQRVPNRDEGVDPCPDVMRVPVMLSLDAGIDFQFEGPATLEIDESGDLSMLVRQAFEPFPPPPPELDPDRSDLFAYGVLGGWQLSGFWVEEAAPPEEPTRALVFEADVFAP